jgi:excisionase family DNA binding protein
MPYKAPISGISGQEAAEILGVSRNHVYRMVCTGELRKARRYQHFGLELEDVEQLSLQRWKRGTIHP